MKEIGSFSTLSFDCYGTLIDWETGIWDALQPLLVHNRADHIGRGEALEVHAELESIQQRATPALSYPDVLVKVHQGFAKRFGLATHPELDAEFGASVPHWPAFPDTAESLRRLEKRFELVILSNVDRAGFAASSRKLGATFAAIFTAEDLGAYKPAKSNFEAMIAALAQTHDVAKGSILHVAQSLYHDHVPASEIGLATAWIDRQDLRGSGSWGATAKVDTWPEIDFRFRTLTELADAVEEATSG